MAAYNRKTLDSDLNKVINILLSQVKIKIEKCSSELAKPL